MSTGGLVTDLCAVSWAYVDGDGMAYVLNRSKC